MVTVIVRVWMPDRPGALGQVASRIGAVRGDVLGIAILERGAGRVVDELTVGLPAVELVPLLIQEVNAVDGVTVEDIREIEPDRADPDLATLAAAAALAEAEPPERRVMLVDAVARIVEADWAVALRDERVVAAVGNAPEVGWLTAFLAGTEHLSELDDGLPGDLVWAHLIDSRLTVAAGRAERAIHERERVRVNLLTRLADALL